MNKRQQLHEKILEHVKEYFATPEEGAHFIPGETKIQISFPCYDHHEINAAIDSLLKLQISQGKKVALFEKEFSNYIGTQYGVAVNSGSSANLLAINALRKAGILQKGMEVIVPAATFTTVVSPLLQHDLVPTFVDIDRETINISPSAIEQAINGKTGLIMPVHSFGCPATIDTIMDIANAHNIPVLEDCCEAHGAALDGKKVGSYGLLSTYSFFVAHNMTSGEGGIVLTNDKNLETTLRSLREFGRLMVTDKTKPRFFYSDGHLENYDERYVFENIGYNVRMTDIHAALGIEQLRKLDISNTKRVETAEYYTNHLQQYSDVLQFPHTSKNKFHSYYGYTIVIRENAPFTRTDLVRFLEDHKIETRALMGGNLAVQPAYRNENIRIADALTNTNHTFKNGFFIGCHPFITDEQRAYVAAVFDKFMQGY